MVLGADLNELLDLLIPIFAAISLLVAVWFALRALQFRYQSSHAPYGVAQVEARKAMQIDLVRSFAAVIIGLIFFGVAGLTARPADDTAAVDPTQTPAAVQTETSAPAPTDTLQPTQTTPVEAPTTEPTATSPVIPPTPLPQPTVTSSAEPLTATVSAAAGVWLRATPSTDGDQLEWLLDGTVLELMAGTESVEELDWQQVRTLEGVEGWVAAPYISREVQP